MPQAEFEPDIPVFRKGVPRQGFRWAENFYKKSYIRTVLLAKGNILSFVIRIISASRHTQTLVHHRLFYPGCVTFFFSYASILIRQCYIYGHVQFLAFSRKATVCGLPSHVIGCVTRVKRIRNTADISGMKRSITICHFDSRLYIEHSAYRRRLSDKFPNQHGLKQGDALSPLLFNFSLEYAIRRVQKNRKAWNQTGHTSFLSMLMTLI
jgi:hypothetical protein